MRLACMIKMKDKKICAQCRRELHVGVNATCVEEGVIGLKDYVPLGDPLFFCCEECVHTYFDLGDLPSVPKRIP